MREAKQSPRRKRAPRPASPWPGAPSQPAAWRVAALHGSRPAPGRRRERGWGRREGSASAAAGRAARGARAGGHSPPHTAVRDSQSSSSACTHSRRFMLLSGCGRRGPGRGRGGRVPGGERRRESRGACGRARSSRDSRARRLAGRRARSPPALLQPPSLRRGSAAKLASVGGSGVVGGGGRRALSKRLAARPLFLLPVAPAASENAPRSLQGLHFVAHGLAASPLGHVVIGRAGGGARKRERERASRTAPLPARTRQPQPGREREPRGGPTTKAARQL